MAAHSPHHRHVSSLQDDEYIDLQQAQGQPSQQQTSHQFQMSLQQHIQQQLQQQFQRQLQLNLQGGDAAQGGPVVLPEPPDTVLDLSDEDGETGPDGNRRASGNGSSRIGSALSGISSTSSRGLLETLLRSAQVASSSSSHQNSNNNSSGGGARGAEGSVISRGGGSEGGPGIVGLGRGGNLVGNNGQASLPIGHAHHHHYHGNGGGEGDGVGPSSGPSGAGGTSQTGNRGGAPGQGIQQPAELTLLYKWAAESGIFILLLLLHFLYDHRLGITYNFLLHAVFLSNYSRKSNFVTLR